MMLLLSVLLTLFLWLKYCNLFGSIRYLQDKVLSLNVGEIFSNGSIIDSPPPQICGTFLWISSVMEDYFPLEGRYEFWKRSKVIIMLVNKNGFTRYLKFSAIQFQFTFSPYLLTVASKLYGHSCLVACSDVHSTAEHLFLSFVKFWISCLVYILFSVTCLYILFRAYVTQQPCTLVSLV